MNNQRKLIIIGAIVAIVFLFFIFDNKQASSSIQIDQNSSVINEESVNTDQQNEDNINETSEPLEFNGYECTDDCSGHEAGYNWAEEHGITQEDVDNYSGNSDSFREGMQSFVDGY